MHNRYTRYVPRWRVRYENSVSLYVGGYDDAPDQSSRAYGSPQTVTVLEKRIPHKRCVGAQVNVDYIVSLHWQLNVRAACQIVAGK
jgi:hypothetical protein